MKQALLLLLTVWTGLQSISQTTETFTNTGTASSSYTSRTWTGDNGLQWTATDARNDLAISGPAITIRNGAITCNSIPNGITAISFKHQQQFTGSGSVLEVRINGNLIGTVSPTTTVQTASFSGLSVTGSFNLEIKQVTAGLRIAIDDVAWTNNNTTTCSSPTAQPTTLSFGAVTNTTIEGNFTAATPAADKYLVVMSTSNTLTASPQNGSTYSEDDALGNGTIISTGSGNSFTAANLTPGTTYYFYIFSFNANCNGGPLYNTNAPLTGFSNTTTPPACTTPTSPPGAITTNASGTSINGSFAAAAGADGYLVIRSNSSSFTFTPSNGTSYTAGQTVGTNGTVVRFGDGTTFAATGLTTNTTYYFFIYSVSNFTCTGGPLYNTTASTASATTTNSTTGEPAGYYANAANKSCADLKTSLKTIITTGNTLRSYGDLWTQYTVSDVKARERGPGTTPKVIWDIYTDIPNALDSFNFTPGATGYAGQCGNYSNEGDCYNREHSFPQSWFTTGTSTGPGTDFHHIFPTDGKVNGVRASYVFGEVSSATYTSTNRSRLGSSAVAGINGPVFEPINEYKGDLARAFLYMVTRWEDNMPTWGNLSGSFGLQALEPNTYPSVDIPYLQLMIKWHNQDPVSQKEIDRNNAAYTYQGNRNPYVDHPEYVALVWNNTCPNLSTLPVDILSFTGRLMGNRVALSWVAENEMNFDRYEVERSVNGTSYNTIGQVKAANLRNYSFNDDVTNLKGRRLYYRLKAVDKDGRFKHSPVFSTHIPSGTNFTIYPNPASNFIWLQLNKSVTGNMTIQVTDVSGKLLQQQKININGSTAQVDTRLLSGGMYLVKMDLNGEVYTRKLVIVK